MTIRDESNRLCRPEDLSALLDGELAPRAEAELRAHVAGCEACAGLDRFLREGDASLRGRPLPVPQGLRGRLLAATVPPRPSRWARPTRAAAALLVAGAATWLAARSFFLDRPAPPDALTAYATQQAWIDALELETASLRLTLETEPLDPEARARLEGTARSLLDRLQRLREESRAWVATAGGTRVNPLDETEDDR